MTDETNPTRRVGVFLDRETEEMINQSRRDYARETGVSLSMSAAIIKASREGLKGTSK